MESGMGEIEEGDIIKVYPMCELDPNDPKYFEFRDYDGEMCKYFPYTGAYYGLSSKKIVKNDGGRKDFDGSAMVTKRHADRRAAIAQGLAEAAIEEGIGSTPTDMLAQVIKNQAIQALEQTRDGTGAAKLIWGIVGMDVDDKGGKQAAVTVELNADAVEAILKKLAEGNGGDEPPTD